ncbi:TetR/AcrR family transcriptional regulator [Phreatobacter sp.]|uniref:TetR/AcrR family transcriptional regulator n=1 Tax=Phreatobacter sp. TaxID=1966341 RepID=UPI0025F9C78A|nr:TetR/AcrR family transcriptional regulator [Phreatobacter sp.]
MTTDLPAKRARLRDDLILAAETAIAKGGLSALKARTLAETAGCAVGAIYNVFPDLDALIFAVNARTLEKLDAVLAATVRPDTDPETAMRRLALAYHGFSRAERRRWTAVFAHQIPDGSSPPDWYLGVVGKLFRHIEGPLATLLPDATPEVRGGLARTLFSATHGIVSLGLEEKLGPAPDEVIAQALVVMTRGWVLGLPGAVSPR